jgi:hypothetical protein
MHRPSLSDSIKPFIELFNGPFVFVCACVCVRARASQNPPAPDLADAAVRLADAEEVLEPALPLRRGVAPPRVAPPGRRRGLPERAPPRSLEKITMDDNTFQAIDGFPRGQSPHFSRPIPLGRARQKITMDDSIVMHCTTQCLKDDTTQCLRHCGMGDTVSQGMDDTVSQATQVNERRLNRGSEAPDVLRERAPAPLLEPW